MKRMAKIIFLWLSIGLIYYALEGLWRIPQGGYANIVMLPIGGLCGVLIGGINQIPQYYNLKVVCQAAIGTVIVLVVEFVARCILNIGLGLGIWDYSRLPFNILGQICLPFAFLWFLLVPFAIWFEDYLRYVHLKEGTKYSVIQIYKEFFTLK